MLKITIRPLAQQDIEEIVDWLKQENPQVAKRFIQELERSFQQLQEHPLIGHLRRYSNPALQNIRMFPIKHYSSYLIFYQTAPEQIQVIRVLHGARDIAALFTNEPADEDK